MSNPITSFQHIFNIPIFRIGYCNHKYFLYKWSNVCKACILYSHIEERAASVVSPFYLILLDPIASRLLLPDIIHECQDLTETENSKSKHVFTGLYRLEPNKRNLNKKIKKNMRFIETILAFEIKSCKTCFPQKISKYIVGFIT